MKQNDPSREVPEMAMTKAELIGMLEAIKIIGELTDDAKEVCKAITRIQDKMNEPNAQAVASNTR